MSPGRTIVIERLDAAAFRPFGDVIELRRAPDVMIDRGLCGRHHDLAALDFTDGGRAGISLFDATPYALPHVLDLVERHPLGSQAFLPMSGEPFLVVVAEDENEAYPHEPIGYGRTPPDPARPDEAALALQIVLDVEEGGENDIRRDGPTPAGGSAPPTRVNAP